MAHGEGCACGCGGQLLLADDRTTDEERQKLSMAFEEMMRTLYKEEGGALRIDLIAAPKVQAFIDQHANILNSALPTQDLTPRMRERLERSNWIFSGMKTFHELHEAFPSLLDEHGQRKPFATFLQDVQIIDKTYNQHYLRAEYNFVQQSAEMARKWEQFAQDGDRYYLQYRTANDDRVRPEHEEMDRITLPMDDPFWEEFYPPNGWNCRCNVVQVRKSKYAPTSPTEAIERAAGATGRDTRGVFRFNPGIEESTVPAHNPYTISRCNTCPIAHNKRKGRMELAKFVPSNEACAACQLLQECQKKKSKSAKQRYHYTTKVMGHLKDVKVTKPIITEEGKSDEITIKFNSAGIGHLYSDAVAGGKRLKYDDLKDLDKALKKAQYQAWDKNHNQDDEKKKEIESYLYFKTKLNGKTLYLNVAKTVSGNHGRKYVNYYVYGVSKNILTNPKDIERYKQMKKEKQRLKEEAKQKKKQNTSKATR